MSRDTTPPDEATLIATPIEYQSTRRPVHPMRGLAGALKWAWWLVVAAGGAMSMGIAFSYTDFRLVFSSRVHTASFVIEVVPVVVSIVLVIVLRGHWRYWFGIALVGPVVVSVVSFYWMIEFSQETSLQRIIDATANVITVGGAAQLVPVFGTLALILIERNQQAKAHRALIAWTIVLGGLTTIACNVFAAALDVKTHLSMPMQWAWYDYVLVPLGLFLLTSFPWFSLSSPIGLMSVLLAAFLLLVVIMKRPVVGLWLVVLWGVWRSMAEVAVVRDPNLDVMSLFMIVVTHIGFSILVIQWLVAWRASRAIASENPA